MFQQRQLNEIYPLIEISFTSAISIGAAGSGATSGANNVVCTLQGGAPATFALGDELECIAPSTSGGNGGLFYAAPTATPGTCAVGFTNPTGGSITPTASTVYKIIAKRFAANINS
jgi:hypothetical protein